MKNTFDTTKFGPWAIITGASSGIGKEFARQLVQKGFNLVLIARRLELLENLGNTLSKKHSIEFRCLQLDLSIEGSYQKIFEKTANLDVGLLISNAGTGRPGRFLDHSTDDLNEIIHINGL